MNKDTPLTGYFSDNERFADFINTLCGAVVLHGDDLSEADSMTGIFSGLPFSRTSRKRQKLGKKYRDIIRKAAFGMNFIMIGLENQSQVHYLMPLRAMVYDAAEYEKQAHFINKKVKKVKGLSSPEFLSGFLKTSRLHPCITFVLNWGDHWDGAKDLHELLDFQDIPSELRKLINNYPLHIISVKEFEDTDLFQTDLKQVFNFVRCSDDKEKLKQLVATDNYYQGMEEDAYDVVAAFTNADKLISTKKEYMEGGKVNMCKALTELIADGRDEGRTEGISIGRTEGISIGRTEGREEHTRELIQKKLAKGKSISTIADELEETEEEIQRLMKAM